MSEPSASTTPPSARWTRLLWAAGWLVAVLLAARPILALLQAFAVRVGYPLDLEWMEGGQLVHAQRLLAGEPIYVPCDHGFIPFPYPPGHFTALALVGSLGGVGFLTGRLLSVAMLMLCLAVLGREIWRAAPSRLWGEVALVLGVAAVASGYPVVDGWYDLVRVDMLFAALVIGATWAVCALRRGDRAFNLRLGIALGLTLTLAVFTKQTAIVYAPWLVLVAFLRDRRAALVAAGVALTTSLALLGGLQLATDGWYWTEVFRVMSGHALVWWLVELALLRLWTWAPWLPFVPLLALLVWRGRWLRRRTAIWTGTLLVAAAQSLASSAKVAAHVNNLMMLVVLAGPVTLLLAADLWRGLRSWRWRMLPAGLGLGLATWIASSWPGRYPQYEPSRADVQAARALIRQVAELDGDVIAPSMPFLPIQAGHGLDQPSTQAYHDHGSLEPGELDLFACGVSTEAAWAVMNTAPTPPLRGLLLYRFLPYLSLDAPFTRSGYITRAQRLLARRVELERVRPRVVFDFEQGGYDGWTKSGEAFDAGPLQRSRWIWGSEGQRFASSLHPRLGDKAVGTLLSPPFLLDRSHISMLVGGGVAGVSVEILVDGGPRLRAVGAEGPVLVPWVRDLSSWRGHTVRLLLVDRASGGWGHIHLDEVVLFDVPPAGG